MPGEQALGEPELLEAFAAHRLVALVVEFAHAVEGHVEPPREDLAELGLARPGRAVEEDVHARRTALERAGDHPLDVVAVAGHVVEVRPFELARGRRISKSHLSEIESGRKQPRLELIERYSDEFGIPTSSILFFSECLDNPSKSASTANKGRGIIARKIITFLRLIEDRTAHAQEG